MDQVQSQGLDGYAKSWATISAELAAQQHYVWMAGQLGRRKAVLEVGCGCGQSTEALVKGGARVWAVDIDPAAVALCETHLRSQGVAVEVVPFDRLGQPSLAQVRLSVADAFDEHFVGMTAPLAIDAVALWFVGATPEAAASALGQEVDKIGPEQMAQFRDKLQLRTMRIAGALLQPGGVLHVVDRARVDWSEKDRVRQSVAAQMDVAGRGQFKTPWRDVFMRKIDAGAWEAFSQQSGSSSAIARHAALCSITCTRAEEAS